MKTRSPLAVIFLTVFIDLLGFGILIPILPHYALHFDATPFVGSLLNTTYSFMQLLFAPVWGRLSDRIGRRRVIAMTAAAAMVSYLMFGISESLWLLFVARAFAGACGANISTAQAFIADVTTPENRARGMALIGAGFGLGFTFGPLVAFVATSFGGIRAPFFVAAALAGLNAIWAWKSLPELTPRRDPHATPSKTRSLADAFQVPSLAFYLIVFFLVVFAFSNIETTFAYWMKAQLGFGTRESGLAFTYIGLVLSLVQLSATRRLSARYGELPLVIGGTALMAAGALTTPLVSTWWQLGGPITLIAAGNALNSPALMASISRNAPAERQGEMLGVAQSVGALARIVGPAVGGYLFDHVGRGSPYVAAGALLALASLLVTARRARDRGTSTAR